MDKNPSAFRIGFDVSALDPTFKAHAARGIGRYVSSLNDYFSSRDAIESSNASSEGMHIHQFQHSDMVPDSWTSWMPLGKTTLRQQLLYPLQMRRYARKHRLQAYHFPAHMDPPAWSPVPYIVTVLDLIPLVCADMYRADRPGWRFHLARWLELRAIRGASRVIAISECTKQDVHRLLGVPEEKIHVTHLGVDERFFKQRTLDEAEEAAVRKEFSLGEKRPLIMYVGGIDERKNVPEMISVFKELVQRAKEKGKEVPCLLLAGKIESDRHYPLLKQQISDLDLEQDVLLPGFVTDEKLTCLFSIANVFWFMSLYEGFGLPPLEACAAGVPVVSSNTSVMPEVLGDAAVLVDPTDRHAVIEAMESVLDSPDLQAELSQRGPKQARCFPWSKTGAATIEAYQAFYADLARGSIKVPSSYQRVYGGDQHSSS